MPNDVRVRFAPSPTGPLHVGGLRTALYNYLFAKKNNGKFILRIEDTDQGRYVEGSDNHIIESLNWTGLMIDEGPYRQSERKLLYKKKILELVHKEKAYYAFDTKEELDSYRQELEMKGEVFVYNSENRVGFKNSLSLGKKRTKELLANKTPHVIRFKTPKNSKIIFKDLLKGEISVNSSTLDDKVLYKADGSPTYHFANVVDDKDMAISHVIRGEEWLPSLPLHWLIYDSFGWKKPDFLHLPLILKPDGNGKLSKRDGDRLGFPVFPTQWLDLETDEYSTGYRESGFFPDAFINMLSLLGWNPGTTQEIFSMEELIENFSLERVGKAGAKYDFDKTKWFNQQYLRKKPNKQLAKEFKDILNQNGINAEDNFVENVCKQLKERATFIKDIWEEGRYYFIAPLTYDEKTIRKKWNTETPEQLKELMKRIKKILDFTSENIEIEFKNYLDDSKLGMGKLLPQFRVAITGLGMGPSIFDIASLLGKEETISRMETAINNIR